MAIGKAIIATSITELDSEEMEGHPEVEPASPPVDGPTSNCPCTLLPSGNCHCGPSCTCT
ncbi:hypothetical protein BT96DRAFT_929635 [Gymnopus androsaceus JB14]|uniref:Uncharacterized protein n=1 Tax=Gymnopus androsaceus JB14 TaxID=1447944 RepID=A0A6A4GDS3_9AGAR|nr:hypothetical protein BT96DRAFT_929635 [Gymnopus androsaceus JB14]